MFNPKNPIGLVALNNARGIPQPPSKFSSRTADKFVIRTSRAMLDAVLVLGRVRGRSQNSEVVEAVLASLAGRQRVIATRNIYAQKLGPTMAAVVLATVERFGEAESLGKDKANIRLPYGVRSAIADAVERSKRDTLRFRSMNTFITDALVFWINNQRECNALLSACIEQDESLTLL
ncbi:MULTISPECIES: Arc family DNA-binding protein [Pseudomonas]|jgi:hypothetical protein|uniref:Arc family DNA-binding protein n=1 Tax=Pseudomonas TaxID=286 RepID=UPI0018E7D6AA|nr:MULTISPECIES: Arc family DNA-binding protein [Pseudomonas]MBJ2214115.1 Arc family DNA-binding protein [Pseudomonas carnis]MBP5947983.1 Arc family DNA-binding protein [Pseudomonas sp. P9(2020)]